MAATIGLYVDSKMGDFDGGTSVTQLSRRCGAMRYAYCALRFCLKYRRSGGGWSFLVGISRPSALRK